MIPIKHPTLASELRWKIAAAPRAPIASTAQVKLEANIQPNAMNTIGPTE